MFIVTNEIDISVLRNRIMHSVEITAQRIRDCQETTGVLDSMFHLRFQKLGHDPIEHTALNFVEQLNQTFSDLVVLEAARYLVFAHPGKKFMLHLGTEAGFDIVSDDGTIVAECFAVTTVKSNEKLSRDSKKLMKCETCEKRYVFLYSQFDDDGYLNKRYLAYPDICFVRIESLY